MRRADLAWAIVRITFGLSLCLFHGYAKVFGGGVQGLTGAVANLGFPHASLFAWAAALSELAGGALLALGLATRPAAAFIAFTMGVALYSHRAELAHGELALLYLVVAVFALVAGGGAFSLDTRLRLRLPVESKG